MNIEVLQYNAGKTVYKAVLEDDNIMVTGIGPSRIKAIEDALWQLSAVRSKIKNCGDT